MQWMVGQKENDGVGGFGWQSGSWRLQSSVGVRCGGVACLQASHLLVGCFLLSFQTPAFFSSQLVSWAFYLVHVKSSLLTCFLRMPAFSPNLNLFSNIKCLLYDHVFLLLSWILLVTRKKSGKNISFSIFAQFSSL